MITIEHPLYQKDLHEAAKYVEKHCAFPRSSSILIIGATGLIGSFLTDLLVYFNININTQFDIYITGRNLHRLKKRFCYAIPYRIHFFEYDVTYPLDRKINFNYIFHLASNADPGTYALYPVETITTNVLGSIHVLNYAKEHPASQILFTSSMEVYGENNGTDLQECDYGKIDYNQIRSGYPESKRVSELLYKSALKQYGIQSYIARLGYIYGPTMTDSDNKVIAQFLRAAIYNQDLVLKSPGLQRRTYCYVADAVTGIMKIMSSGIVGESYNVADKNSLITIKQLGEIIAQQVNKNLVMECSLHKKEFFDSKKDIVLDCSKLEQLGWHANTEIVEGITKTIRILSK